MLSALGFILVFSYMISDVHTVFDSLNLTLTGRKERPDIRVSVPDLPCANETHQLKITENDQTVYVFFDSTMFPEHSMTIQDFEPGHKVTVELWSFCKPMQVYSNWLLTADSRKPVPHEVDIHRDPPMHRRLNISTKPVNDGMILAKAMIPSDFFKCEGKIMLSVRYTTWSRGPGSAGYLRPMHKAGPVEILLQPFILYMIDLGVWCDSAVTVLYGYIASSVGMLTKPLVTVDPSLYTARVFLQDSAMQPSIEKYYAKLCPTIGVSNCTDMEIKTFFRNKAFTVGGLLSGTDYTITVRGSKVFRNQRVFSEPVEVEFKTDVCGPACSGLPDIRNMTIHPDPAAATFAIEYGERDWEMRFHIVVCPLKGTSCASVYVPRQGNLTSIKVSGLQPRTRYNATITPEVLDQGIKTGSAYTQMFTTKDCSSHCAGVWGNLSLEVVPQPNYANILVGLPEEVWCDNPTYELQFRNETMILNSTHKAMGSVTLSNFPYWHRDERFTLHVKCDRTQTQAYVGHIETGPGRLNAIRNVQVKRDDRQLTVTVTCHNNLEVYPNRFRIDLCLILQGTCNRTLTICEGQITTFNLTDVNPNWEYELTVIPEFHYKNNWLSGQKKTKQVLNSALRSLAASLVLKLIPPNEDGNAGFKVISSPSQCGVDQYRGYIFLAKRIPDVPNFQPIGSWNNEILYNVLECWTTYKIRIYCPALEGYMTRTIYTGPGPLRRPRYMLVHATDKSAEIHINHRFLNDSLQVEFETQLCEAFVWVCTRRIVNRTGQITVVKFDSLIPESKYLFAAAPRLILSESEVYLGGVLHTEFDTPLCEEGDCYTFNPVQVEARALNATVHVKWTHRLGYRVNITVSSTYPGIYRSRALKLYYNKKEYIVIHDLLPGVEYTALVMPLGLAFPGVSVRFTTLECGYNCTDLNRTLSFTRRHFFEGEVLYWFNPFEGQQCVNQSFLAAITLEGSPETTRFKTGNTTFTVKFILFTAYDVKVFTWCNGNRSYLYKSIFQDYKEYYPPRNLRIFPEYSYAVVKYYHEPQGPRRKYELTWCTAQHTNCRTITDTPFPFETEMQANLTELEPNRPYTLELLTLIITGTGTVTESTVKPFVFHTKSCRTNCPEPQHVKALPINYAAATIYIYTEQARPDRPLYFNVTWCDIWMQSCAFEYKKMRLRNDSLQIRFLKEGTRYTVTVYEVNGTAPLVYRKAEFATPECGQKCGREPYLGFTSIPYNDSATVTVLFPVYVCHKDDEYSVYYIALTHYGLISEGPITSGTRVIEIKGVELWTTFAFRAYYRCGKDRKYLYEEFYTGPGPLHAVDEITAEATQFYLDVTIHDKRNPEVTNYTVKASYGGPDVKTSIVPRDGPRTVIRKQLHDIILQGGNFMMEVVPWIALDDVTYKGKKGTVLVNLHCSRTYPVPMCDAEHGFVLAE